MEIRQFLKDVGNQTNLMTVDLTIDGKKNTETFLKISSIMFHRRK